ncbi:MAG: hypothetical protein J6S91_10485 [Treponema sp.]|nr:hypothetical protein [Treponema sp.]
MNVYEQYKNRVLPKQIQGMIEGFAGATHGDESEQMFRAGFKIGINIDELNIIRDIEEMGLSGDYVIVAKKDMTLDWFKRMREMITKEQTE